MYFVFVTLIVLIYFIVDFLRLSKEEKHKVFCFCAFLVILFVHLFKDNSIYPDLFRYEDEFDGIADITNIREFFILYFGVGGYFHEIGWSLLNFFCTRFTDDFTLFLNIVSIGICTGYSYGIYKLSRSPLFSFLFIMLYSTALPQSFYVLRQHLAFSLFFFLVPCLLNNQYKRFFPGFCFILSLHYSSIILLPFVCFYKMGDKLFSFKRFIFAGLLVVAFAFLLGNVTYERYAGYVTENGGNYLGVILTGGVFLVLLLTRKTKSIKDQYSLYMQTYIFYSFVVCLGCMGSNTGRLTNYFTFLLSSTIPYVVQRFSQPIRLVVYSIFLIFSILINMNTEWSYLYYKLLF